MQVSLGQLKQGAPVVSAAMSNVRSARNQMSRKRRGEGQERAEENVRRRSKRMKDREAEAFLRKKIRIRVAEADRPKTRNRTPHKLFTRTAEGLLVGWTGATDARGPDGLYSIHFSSVGRGFASETGRVWREGEGCRAALYSVREDALEEGELGWSSNIAVDRNELVGFFRVLEAVEKHDRSNANVYRAEVIALPAELSAGGRRRAVERMCQRLDKKGLPYVYGIHLPDRSGDQRNFHVHLIYSTRPCRRLSAYDWEFGAAKDTSINTPDGLRSRRVDVVSDINTTLAEEELDKRYTHLSNRERGMKPPTDGKHGQKRTYIDRRLKTVEERQARLTVFHQRITRLQQRVVEAATRMSSARTLVLRRCLLLHMRTTKLVAAAAVMPSMRDHVREMLQKRAQAVAAMMATGRSRIDAANSAVRLPPERLADRSEVGVAKPTNLALSKPEATVEPALTSPRNVAQEAFAAAVVVHAPLALRSGNGRSRSVSHSTDAGQPATKEDKKVLANPGASIRAAMKQAVGMREEQLRDALERTKGKRIRRSPRGRYVVDVEGSSPEDLSVLLNPAFEVRVQRHLAALFDAKQAAGTGATNAIPAAAVVPVLARELEGSVEAGSHSRRHDPVPQETEHGTEKHPIAQAEAVRRRRRGLEAVAGLAGLRILRPIIVDAGREQAHRILPGAERADLRGGRAVHQQVRGPEPSHLKEAGAPEADAKVATEPKKSGGLLKQAAALRPPAEPSRAKGPADCDAPLPPVTRGRGR